MRIISLNTNGLSNFQKFKCILTKLKSFSPDIILFQEVFNYNITPNRLRFHTQMWSSIWKGDIHATPYIAILVSPQFKSNLSFESLDHRIMDINIYPPHSPPISIRNVYAPADHTRQRSFWTSFPPSPPPP